ncbi:outer membrane beta-barrel protein [Pedobacter sp. 22226]|uniref:outer membrane beta-barrel protein n=1 Tax=Pedobacter sp. 22226 TaxID=3453894 RepID=UPI003F83E3DB
MCKGQQGSIGISGGLAANNINFRTASTDLEIRNRLGAAVSVNYIHPLKGKLFVEGGIGGMKIIYTVKNTRNGIFQTYSDAHLQLPFMIGYDFSVSKKMYLPVSVGLIADYWISGQISGLNPNVFSPVIQKDQQASSINLERFDSGYAFKPGLDKRFTAGVGASVGIAFLLYPRLSVLPAATVLYMRNGKFMGNSAPVTPRFFAGKLSLGILYNFYR